MTAICIESSERPDADRRKGAGDIVSAGAGERIALVVFMRTEGQSIGNGERSLAPMSEGGKGIGVDFRRPLGRDGDPGVVLDDVDRERTANGERRQAEPDPRCYDADDKQLKYQPHCSNRLAPARRGRSLTRVPGPQT